MENSSEYCISSGMVCPIVQNYPGYSPLLSGEGHPGAPEERAQRLFLLQLCPDRVLFLHPHLPGTGLFGGGYPALSAGGQQARFDTFVDKQYEALLAERAEIERKIAVIGGTRALLKEIRQADTGGRCCAPCPRGLP